MNRSILVGLVASTLVGCSNRDEVCAYCTDTGVDAAVDAPIDAPVADAPIADGGQDTGPADMDTGLADTGVDAPVEVDAGPLCADRTGGALITFNVDGQSFIVWMTNQTFIETALELLVSGDPMVPNFLTLEDGQDCDPHWTWHPDPNEAEWAELTYEVCNARPSEVESDKPYWLDTLDQFCPWTATVVAVDDRR